MCEQLHQDRAIDIGADQMHLADALLAGMRGMRQIQLHVALRQFAQQLGYLRGGDPVDAAAFGVNRVAMVEDEHQLVGLQRNRGMGGDFFQRQVEHFAGGRIADWRKQHDFAGIQAVADRGDGDLAYFAGELQINPVNDSGWLRGNVIAGSDANVGARHRRIRQTDREHAFDIHPHRADCVLDVLQRFGVGHPAALHVLVFGGQTFFYLRPHAMHQHQTHAKRIEQVDVVNQIDEILAQHRFTAKREDKGFAAKSVDIRCGGTKPFDERYRFRFSQFRHCLPPD